MKNNIDNELIKMSFKFEKNNIENFINSKNLRINKLMVKYNIRLNNEHDKIKETAINDTNKTKAVLYKRKGK